LQIDRRQDAGRPAMRVVLLRSRRLMIKCCLMVWIVFGVWIQEGWGQDPEHYFIAVSTLVARPLGMGGAFTAVNDDLAALLYNPASFTLYQDYRARRFTVFLNPVAPIVALQKPEALFGRAYYTWEEAAAVAAMLVKGMTLSLGAFEFGALFGEQSPQPEHFSAPRVFNANDYLDNQYNILAMRMRVAERVSLGGSLGLYYRSDAERGRRWGVGTSYGVQVRPSRRVAVGVSYITFPQMAPDYREAVERIVDGGVNLGVSVHSKFGTIIAVDFRNLGYENAATSELMRETHLGVEQVLLSHLALRAGAFRKRYENAENRYVLSAGVGLADANGFWTPKRRFSHANWIFNYGVVTETLAGQRRFYHALSMIFRL
jgi:hypothetical protein